MFAGIGGADLAIEHVMGASTAWQLDIVGAAIRRRHWPDAEQVEADVTTVDPATLPPVDVIAAGFPCQDLSCAGKGAGLEGAKSGLYREVLRFVARLAPRYVAIENVSGLLPYMPRLCADFAGFGYGLAWTTCRALDAGHPHERLRVFVVAERGAPYRGLVPCPSGDGRERPWPTLLASNNSNWAGSHDKAMDGLEIAVRTGAHLMVPPRSERRNLAHERSGILYRSERMWATPTGSNPNEGEDPASWQARRERTAATSRPISEPPAQQARPWPTPTVRGNDNVAGLSPTSGDGLATACRLRAELGSRLSPEWVEALMGYPMGWTSSTGPRLRYNPYAPAVRGRYPVGWDRSQVWPGHAWEPPRTIPDGPPVPGRPARIRALGNAWCPQQGALALRTLLDVPAQASMW